MEALDALAPQARLGCRARLEEMRQFALPADGSARAGRAQLVKDTAEHRVFVGEHTLEVDRQAVARRDAGRVRRTG